MDGVKVENGRTMKQLEELENLSMHVIKLCEDTTCLIYYFRVFSVKEISPFKLSLIVMKRQFSSANFVLISWKVLQLTNFSQRKKNNSKTSEQSGKDNKVQRSFSPFSL
jgi:hypothetical protein